MGLQKIGAGKVKAVDSVYSKLALQSQRQGDAKQLSSRQTQTYVVQNESKQLARWKILKEQPFPRTTVSIMKQSFPIFDPPQKLVKNRCSDA